MLDPQTRQLLQDWLDAPNHEPLFTFVETLIDQRNRAEFQTQAYIHQIKVLTERTNNILQPLLNPKSIATSNATPRVEAGATKPSPNKPKPPPTKPTSTKSFGISLKL